MFSVDGRHVSEAGGPVKLRCVQVAPGLGGPGMGLRDHQPQSGF